MPPAGDSNQATKQVGQVDQTKSDDFVPRQKAALAAGASPAEVVAVARVPGENEQVVMSRHAKPGEPLKKFEGETKTIITNVTVHVPTEDHVPFKLEGNGVVQAGHYSTFEVPPGTPVTLEAREADKMLARFGGREVGPDENPVVSSTPRLNDRGPEGDTAANPPPKPGAPTPAPAA